MYLCTYVRTHVRSKRLEMQPLVMCSPAASGWSLVASRWSTAASGQSTVASGRSTAASGQSTAASGRSTAASGQSTATSGRSTVPSGRSTAASGRSTLASGRNRAAIRSPRQHTMNTYIHTYACKTHWACLLYLTSDILGMKPILVLPTWYSAHSLQVCTVTAVDPLALNQSGTQHKSPQTNCVCSTERLQELIGLGNKHPLAHKGRMEDLQELSKRYVTCKCTYVTNYH